MKNSIVLATAVAAILTSSVATAELSANAAFTSNYIWRGVTQTADQAAGQGGIDWGNDIGIYAGTWVSNIAGGYEMDVYAGFAGEAGSVGYDLGIITYQYPVDTSLNFTEVYLSGSVAGLSAGIALTVDKAGDADNTDDIYIHAGYDFSAYNIDYSIYVGDYSFDADSSGDYIHYGASLGKDGFTLAVDKNDIEGGSADNVRFTVSYAIDFEL